jgi:hypothetical protein
MGTLSIQRRFVRPGPHAASAIRQELEKLPIQDLTAPVLDSERQFSGGIDATIEYLHDCLEDDYRETEVDSADGGYEFDYVLTQDGYSPCELAILTRLFSHTKPGNIFYALGVVRRTSKDRYLVTDAEK